MTETQAFLAAIKGGDEHVVAALTAEDPALVNLTDEQGRSAVILAVYYQKPSIAQMLVERGAHLDVFTAAAAGQTDRVAILVDEEPELANAYAADGFQPLGLAAYFGHVDTAMLLLAHGADANSPARNTSRVRPLHSAVAGGHIVIAANLLAHGADANATQADDYTPLHAAAQNGQTGMLQLLLAWGADPCARAATGKTAKDLAQDNKHSAAVSLLSARDPC